MLKEQEESEPDYSSEEEIIDSRGRGSHLRQPREESKSQMEEGYNDGSTGGKFKPRLNLRKLIDRRTFRHVAPKEK